MRFRTIAAVSGMAIFVLGASAHAQLQVMTSSNQLALGKPQELMVSQKFTNPTMQKVHYSLVTPNGQQGEIFYTLVKLQPNNSGQPALFSIKVNGNPIAGVRSISLYNTTGPYSGDIGPGKSVNLGGTLGCAAPANLLQGVPSSSGAAIYVNMAAGPGFTLQEGEQVELLTEGSYSLLVAITKLTIQGYRYGPGAEDAFLTDQRMITVGRP